MLGRGGDWQLVTGLDTGMRLQANHDRMTRQRAIRKRISAEGLHHTHINEGDGLVSGTRLDVFGAQTHQSAFRQVQAHRQVAERGGSVALLRAIDADLRALARLT